MASNFASGKRAIAECDRCGQRYKLKELKKLTIKTKLTNILVCPTCFDPDHPQLQLGMYPVNDPQALRDPRPDNSYWQSGLSGLQVNAAGTDVGTPSQGSRDIQWGWNPVGLNNPLALPDLESTLQASGTIGSVTVQT